MRNAPARTRWVTTRSGSKGVLDLRLDPHEDGQQDDAEGEEPNGERVAPAGLGEAEAVDERAESEGHEQCAPHVVAVVAARLARGEEQRAADQADRHEEEVDQQAPAPVEELGQEAAEHEADGGARTRDRAEYGEGGVALLAGGEQRRQQRERGRRQHGGEDALQAAAQDELPAGGGDAGIERGEAEADHADHEGALAAPVVGDASAEQQQGAEGESVGGDDPLAQVVVHLEGDLRLRQGDVDDGAVEDDDELRQRDDEQRPPLGFGMRTQG